MFLCFFFFKQKTAYEMRISDWSSDVCSSDLALHIHPFPADLENAHLMHGRLGFHEPGVRILIVNRAAERNRVAGVIVQAARRIAVFMQVSQRYLPDRKSVVSGKRGSVRLDLGGRRTIKKKNTKNTIIYRH